MSARRERAITGALALGAVLLVAGVAPVTVVLGVNRLLPLLVLGAGAWVSLRRLGIVDLGTGGIAAVGAYVGAVMPALDGVPPALGLSAGVFVGAVVGALSAAVAARVGRIASAVTTLALGAALVALPVASTPLGGASGFHAVPLVTGSDRGDLIVYALAVVAAGVVTSWSVVGPRFGVARASVVAPPVVAATGRRPEAFAATAGAWSGGLLGLGGGLLATSSGSVAPAAFGLTLSATLALAALIGGGHPAGGMLGVALLYGPALVWPTAPVLGDTPLLLLAPLALALLVWRPDGLLSATPGASPAPGRPAPSDLLRPPEPQVRPERLVLDDVESVPGRRLSFEVAPGEVVALVGPNGVGKSTLLARIGGQLRDGGRVRLGDEPLPTAVVARARAGIARTWQRPEDGATEELIAAHVRARPADPVVAWCRAVLGAAADTPTGRDLQLLALQRPRVALLDEPGASGDIGPVASFVRGLAEGGCAVIVVEHRAELVAEADRVIDMRGGGS